MAHGSTRRAEATVEQPHGDKGNAQKRARKATSHTPEGNVRVGQGVWTDGPKVQLVTVKIEGEPSRRRRKCWQRGGKEP